MAHNLALDFQTLTRPGRLGGRSVVALTLLLYFCFLGWVMVSRGWVTAWWDAGVFAMEPRFHDLAAVLQAVDRYRAGTPVAHIQNRDYEDAHTLSAAYPSVWMWLLAPTGLGQSQTLVLGVILGAGVTTATLLYVGPLTLAEGAFTALLLISPSFMFGIERGNVDLILILFAFLSLWLLPRESPGLTAAAAAVLLLSALLKLYPAAALVSFLKKRGRVALAFGAGALFALYCFLIHTELHRIAANAGRDTKWSFGCMVLLNHLFAVTSPGVRWIELTGLSAALLVAGLSAWIAWHGESVEVKTDMAGFGFLMGAAIYVGCFFIGNNYEYRLWWLILLVPQAFSWIRQDGARARRALLLLAAALLAAYATNFKRLAPLSDLLQWLLFVLLVSLLVSGLKEDLLYTLFRIRADSSTRPASATVSEERSRVAVVIAAYDEEENIAPLTTRLVTTLDSMGTPWSLIYVIEGTDRTLELARDFARQRPEIQILYNPAPSGLGRAFRRGFDAVPADAGIVVTMDADLNHQPEEMPALISALYKTGADIVVGSRRLEHSRTDGAPLWKTITSSMVGITMNVVFGVNVKDMTSGFRVYRASCLRALEYRNDNFAFLPEMLIDAAALGAIIEERPIHFIFRVAGESKMALWRTFRSYVSLFGSLRYPANATRLRRMRARAAGR